MKISPLAAVAALFCACAAPRLQVTPAGGVYSLDGDFGAREGEGASGGTSDLEGLGLDDSEGGFQPRVDLRWLGTHLSISGMRADFSGEGVTEAEIEIDGRTIAAGVPVSTELELADAKAMLTVDLIPGDKVELGLGLAVALLAVDLRMEELSGLGELDTEEAFPVPLGAARLGVHAGRLQLYAEAGYIDISINEGDLTLLDYELGALVELFGPGRRLSGSLAAGWRGVEADAEYDDDDSIIAAEIELDGPFVGFQLSF